jgi:putative ABC transport system permease protein
VFRLVLSNLSQRPTRTIVSMVAVSMGVVLILISVGLTYGQLTDTAQRTRRIGGDFMVQPSDASLFFAFSAGTLPAGIADVIKQVDGVDSVTPILVKFISERFHVVFGIDKASFQQVNDTLRLENGRLFEGPDEVIIDTIYARSHKLKTGDKLELLGHVFTVAGVFEQGTAVRVLMDLEALQVMNGTPDKATVFFVRAEPGVDLEQVYGRLTDRMPHYKITKTAELQDIMAGTTPVFYEFLSAMVFISVGISFLIILLAMYSTITERTREIGILKSLGASRAYIVQLVLKESVLICSLGAGLGFLLTFGTIEFILFTFPSVPVEIPNYWKALALLMAIGGGTLGALYPALKAAQLDPVKALGYE